MEEAEEDTNLISEPPEVESTEQSKSNDERAEQINLKEEPAEPLEDQKKQLDEPQEKDQNEEPAKIQEEDYNEEPVESQENDYNEEPAETQEDDQNEEPVETHEDIQNEETVETQEGSENKEPVETQEGDQNELPAEPLEVDQNEEPVMTQEGDQNEEPSEAQEDDKNEEPVETQQGDQNEEPVMTEEVDQNEEPTESQEGDQNEEPTEPQEGDQNEEPTEPQEGDQNEEPAEAQEDDKNEEPVETQEGNQNELPAEPQEGDQNEEPTEPQEVDQNMEPVMTQEGDPNDEPAELQDGEQKERVDDKETIESHQSTENAEPTESQVETKASVEQESGDGLKQETDVIAQQNETEITQESSKTETMVDIGFGDTSKEVTDVGIGMPSMGNQPHPTMETSAGTEFNEESLLTERAGVIKDATATVKLILVPLGQVVTMAMPLFTTPQGIREVISKELKVPISIIQVLFNGNTVDDRFDIASLGIQANDTVAFEIASVDPENHPLKPYAQSKQVDIPDVITVRIPFDDGQVKDAIVEIERTSRKKPFIGGYRHKKTGKEYHHGASQTYAPARPPPNVERYSRDTQTAQQQHRVQQTFNTTSTQMTKPGVFVSNLTDKFVVPRKYETAEQYKIRMLAKVLIIQTYYRRWLAKRKVNKLRNIRDECVGYEEEVEIKKRKDKEDRIQREFERRMNPRSKEDFDLLYGALEKWRQEEITRIKSTLSGAELKAAMCLLLEQETELIAAIDRHQLDAASENKDKMIQRLLGRAAAPKKWKTETGYSLKMDTAYTLRGKELLDIYNSLNMKYLTQDERLDVLLTLKHTVKEHDCKLTHEIIELIDREADLLMRGVKEDNLNGLRKRLTTLFLQYCKTPTFNPEITHLLKVPQDPSSLRQDIHFCHSCGRYLQATAFNLGIKSTGMGRCRTCLRKDNLARVRQDLSAYKHLLQKLRKQEEGYQDGARIAFLIEEADLRYLVENTWESMSILSSWDDLADLEMVRWRIEEEWSPWNAVLLTRDEVEAHQKVTNLSEAYGDMLAHRVSQKHVLAKNHFSKLEKMAEKMPPTKRHKVGEPFEEYTADGN